MTTSGGGDDGGDGGEPAEEIDYEAIGLWDDGPCDEAAEPLQRRPHDHLRDVVDLARRPGARLGGSRRGVQRPRRRQRLLHRGHHLRRRRHPRQGGRVRVHDGGRGGRRDDQRPAHRRPRRSTRTAMAEAGIPRVAGNPTPDDWDDPNLYPLDASGTGVTVLLPQALIDSDVNEIGVIRVESAARHHRHPRGHLRGRGHLPLRRRGAGRHDGLHAVHPGGRGRRAWAGSPSPSASRRRSR